MASRTSFPRKVFTACLVTFTGILLQSSCTWSCDPTAESTDFKAYRAPIVVEGTLDGSTAYLERKTMKGEFAEGKVSEIQLTGFDSEDPCTGSVSSFSEATHLLFLNETSTPGMYSLVGNPEESSRTGKRAVRKVIKEGGPPSIAKRLKPKALSQGDRLMLTCTWKGTPKPLAYWERDGMRIEDNDIPRLKIKATKRNSKLSIRNVDEALHEGTYTCVLTNTVDPPVNSSSTVSICAIQCGHGQQNARKCKCVCDEGYSGDFCNIPDPTTTLPPTTLPPCTLDCGINGALDANTCTCVCNPGFEGPSCNELVPTSRTPLPISPDNCTLQCGAHGTRDASQCLCLCDEGFGGETCLSDDALACQDGTYCSNGGTCTEVLDSETGSSTFNCSCTTAFIGDWCELERCPDLNCGPNGHLSPTDCSCICEPKYSGVTCSVLSDNHTIPCSAKYAQYCLNGGTCHQLVGINRATCNCPDPYRGSPRCEFIFNQIDSSKAPPVVHPSIEQNSMKVIITLTVIFISLLLVLLLVVFIYIKNKNYQEEKRQKGKTHRNLLRPPHYNAHPLHQNANNRAAVPPSQIVELEMEPRRPSAPPTVLRGASEGSPQQLPPSQRSHSVDVRYSSVPPHDNNTPVVVRTMHNGSARKISQASIHSNRSGASRQSSGSAVVGKRRGGPGYEAVPTTEPVEASSPVDRYHGDSAACEAASIVMIPRSEACSDGESECSSDGDDAVDVPNPQICAIETHLSQPDDDDDHADVDDRDLSADATNANIHFSNPYAHGGLSPMHSPALSRGHSHSNSNPWDVNLHENPMQSTMGYKGNPHPPTNELLTNDGYYGSRYEDDIDRSSPPHAV